MKCKQQVCTYLLQNTLPNSSSIRNNSQDYTKWSRQPAGWARHLPRTSPLLTLCPSASGSCSPSLPAPFANLGIRTAAEFTFSKHWQAWELKHKDSSNWFKQLSGPAVAPHCMTHHRPYSLTVPMPPQVGKQDAAICPLDGTALGPTLSVTIWPKHWLHHHKGQLGIAEALRWGWFSGLQWLWYLKTWTALPIGPGRHPMKTIYFCNTYPCVCTRANSCSLLCSISLQK